MPFDFGWLFYVLQKRYQIHKNKKKKKKIETIFTIKIKSKITIKIEIELKYFSIKNIVIQNKKSKIM